jgi:hypothetical protein
MPAHLATQWATQVLAAREQLVDDFGGAQQALGRAFYTHLESGRQVTYFGDAADSDATVERVVPGLQATTMALLQRLLGAQVRRRHGYCGPGVHVFWPGQQVARRGGVYHYDLDGLTTLQRHLRPPAVSLVWMLQPPTSGGGLSLFGQRYRGVGWDMHRRPRTAATTTQSRPGDVLLFSSYRLHRINGFRGDQARVSITCHAVEVDRGIWEVWF